MENLFVKKSTISVDKLRSGKAFLQRIASNVTSAYSGVWTKTEDSQESTRMEFGVHPNKDVCHSFKVNLDGVVTFASKYTQHLYAKDLPYAEALLKKHPKSSLRERSGNCADFYLVIELHNDTDLVDNVDAIIFMLEKDGFALKR